MLCPPQEVSTDVTLSVNTPCWVERGLLELGTGVAVKKTGDRLLMSVPVLPDTHQKVPLKQQ